ncbi:MAG TPA: tRNA (cytidine(34)-2'-O)-methyltransferase [Parvibaculum sp.]|jgi:tRNA (cytidine/uridine-2'-O-)-methyltransferase
MRLALFEPDIPQNTGTLIRLGACLGVPVDIIEPTGFPWSDRALKRAGLDYWELADVTRHVSWETYLASHLAADRPAAGRLVLLTTKSAEPYTSFAFQPGDTLLLGRETAGVPPEVHAAAGARITIPMRPPARSLNVAIAAAMVLGEALRQTAGPAAGKSATAQAGD